MRNGGLLALIGVMIPPDAIETRNYIRVAMPVPSSMKRFFVMAHAHDADAASPDIMVVRAVESSGFQSIKTLSYFLKAVRRFPQAQWIVKTDSDSYIHFDRLQTALERLPSKVSYTGQFMWSSHTGTGRCGCCGWNRPHAVALRAEPLAAGHVCPANATGPFAFAGGMLFGVRPSAFPVEFARRVRDRMDDKQKPTEFTWNEDNTLGYVMSTSTRLRAQPLCDACLHDYDSPHTPRRLLPLLVHPSIRLTTDNITTGHPSRWETPECFTPITIVAHRIKDIASMRRIHALRVRLDALGSWSMPPSQPQLA